MNKQSVYTAPGLVPVKPVPLGKVIADQFGVTPTALDLPFTKTKKKEIVNARFLFMAYVSKIAGKGPTFTGNKVGRGHADVIHAVRQYNNRFDTEKEYRGKAMTVLQMIEAGKVLLPEFCHDI